MGFFEIIGIVLAVLAIGGAALFGLIYFYATADEYLNELGEENDK